MNVSLEFSSSAPKEELVAAMNALLVQVGASHSYCSVDTYGEHTCDCCEGCGECHICLGKMETIDLGVSNA